MKKLQPKIAWIIMSVIVVLAAGIWAGYFISKKGGSLFVDRTPYAAVYLQTGDMYYGQLRFWPRLHLENVWYIERDQQGQPQLLPYKDLFWSPGDKLYLNPDRIVWWTYLKPDSDLASAFKKAAEQN